MVQLIATVSEKGAGKGLFVKLTQQMLPGKRIAAIRFSDPLRDILAILNKEESRDNLWKLATALRTWFHDEGILIPAIKKRLLDVNADVIILDGIRKPEEVALVKDREGVLLYITADQRLRYDRRSKDPENTDEREMTFEQFAEQDHSPAEISIRSVGETMANARIDNNGTEKEFREQVKKFLEDHGFSAVATPAQP